ncbi:ribonuclease H-like domain-containing protein [Tanacetum coccineum]
MVVKIASWNVKGICNTIRQGEVKTLIKDSNISFFGIVETQLRKKFVNKVCHEVFGVWEWVSNSVDSSKGCRIDVGWDPLVISAKLLAQNDQAMHFLVNSFRDNKQMFIYVIYGEITPKARIRLWKDLIKHKGVMGNEPWVVLGDFNAVLRFNENSSGLNVQGGWNPELGVLKKLDRVMGNACFINSYPNSFATCMPYLTSDHSLAILTILDLAIRKSRSFRFVNFLADKYEFLGVVRENWDIDVRGYEMFKLAKKLKNMKRHMRQMNRRNGNVYEKVKVLKVELSRIQQSLDKDPSNAVLREEEMVYYNASYFHNVVKGRTSRNMIEMILDDLGNAHYGDSVTNLFVSHFETFLGTQDTIYEVEDADNLFTKRLDADKAFELIKDVTNEEIKAQGWTGLRTSVLVWSGSLEV